MAQLPSTYQNNFDPDKGYYQSLHFPGKGVAAAELNELFSLYDNKRIELAKLIVKEGDIIDGASPVVNNATGETRIPAGKIFVKNEVIPYAETTFTIAVDKTVKLGVYIEDVIISGGNDTGNNEDPDLLDPSADIQAGVTYATSGTETSKRLKNKLTWGWKDDVGGVSQTTGVFYEAFEVQSGNLVLSAVGATRSGIVEEIARYDRDVNGNYIVHGFDVSFDYENVDGDFYFLDVKSGVANVNGYKIARTSNDRFSLPIDPDLREVANDPHVITVGNVEYTETITKGSAGAADDLGRPDVQSITSVKSEDGLTTYAATTDYILTGNTVDWSPGGAEPTTGDDYVVVYEFTGATVETDKQPIDNISEVVAELKITDETVVRGAVVDTADNLANTSVLTLVTVKQGATTYTPTTDYVLTGSTVNWVNGGSQPAPSSSYTVTYTYNKTITPDTGSIKTSTYSITNQNTAGDLVDGSTVLTTYDYRLKRIDLLELDQSGTLRRVKGVSQDDKPNVPPASASAIGLATIELDWITDPSIQNIGNIAIKQGELQDLKNKMFTQSILISELSLKLNASLEGASSAGIFTDAFADTDQTDAGKTQTLLITDDILTVPLTLTEGDLSNTNNQSFQTLDPTDDTIVDQSQRTAVMKINPFATFTVAEPLTIDVAIDHQVDDFTSRTATQSSNPDPNSWVKNPYPPRIFIDPDASVVVDPIPPTPAQRMTLTELRNIAKTAKGKNKLKPKGRRQTLTAIAKLNSGENITSVKVGKHTVNLITGAVTKNKKK